MMFWAFAKPFLTDKLVWSAMIGWALALVNAKLKLGLDESLVNNLVGALSVWAVAKVTHVDAVPAAQAAASEKKG